MNTGEVYGFPENLLVYNGFLHKNESEEKLPFICVVTYHFPTQRFLVSARIDW